MSRDVFAAANMNQRASVRDGRKAKQQRQPDDGPANHKVAANRFIFDQFRSQRFPFRKTFIGIHPFRLRRC
jgi:hypothetical protein